MRNRDVEPKRSLGTNFREIVGSGYVSLAHSDVHHTSKGSDTMKRIVNKIWSHNIDKEKWITIHPSSGIQRHVPPFRQCPVGHPLEVTGVLSVDLGV